MTKIPEMKKIVLHLSLTLSLILLLLLTLSLSLTAQEVLPEAVEVMAQEYVSHPHNHGLVIGIIDGTETAIRGYGRLHADDPRQPDEQTIFEIGSITKVFTTTLMMQQSIAGAFDLTDPIQDYLPEGVQAPRFLPYECRPAHPGEPWNNLSEDHDIICEPDPDAGFFCITFCDLATHTSGLPRSPKGLFTWWNPFRFFGQLDDPYRSYSREKLYGKLPRYKLNQAPGILFEYSNLGMALLGNIVSDRAGKPYADLLREKITEPLDMSDTRLTLSEEQQKRFAPGHNKKGRLTNHWHFQAMAPAGGLRSTAADMLAFLSANLETDDPEMEAVFDQVHQVRMETSRKLHDRQVLVGYGWMTSLLDSETNLPVVWHNGATGGFYSFLGFIKDTRTAVVVLSNSANSVDELGFAILEELISRQATADPSLSSGSPVNE